MAKHRYFQQQMKIGKKMLRLFKKKINTFATSIECTSICFTQLVLDLQKYISVT